MNGDSDGPAVVFADVSRRFGEGDSAVDALHAVNLTIPRGAIFGILGESGAGKSTLLRLMNGLDHPTRGRVLVDDVDLATLGSRRMREMRHRIGVVFQHFNLVGNLTARANIAMPLRIQRRRDPARVAAIADFVGLSGLLDRFPAQLSGGQQQRVAIARALVSDPTLLLCDEPTSALDTHTTAEILDLLQATRAEFGTTIALVTHELDAVRAICDTAAVFERGSLLDTVAVPQSTQDREPRYLDHVRAVLGQ